MTPQEFQRAAGITEDPLNRLSAFLELLGKWQARINLVGGDSLRDPWRRHLLDSAQLASLIPETATTIVDIGSGAGFPGLVLAVLGPWKIQLIESNARKSAFLREAARVLGVEVEILTGRVEKVRPVPADVITARACAPLPQLLGYAAPFCGPQTICLFHKGRGVHKELTESQKTWQIDVMSIPSVTDASGVVLKIKGVAPHER
ncbi:MAG: 16S rRNA (guanine(527)-N(7))-methyltransferase RsmG [Rhodospirillales bacterium]|nr:16S rRNA (guanine(527)-N(7))-methyltransferase RsmG [Rhodospirillales bacterium]